MENRVLTIAVPIFNMEWCLEKILSTYCDSRLSGKLEVICLNNASEDRSKEIIEKFLEKYPDVFRLIDRNTRGYGSSINTAIASANGKYFRIVDADDWVNTENLNLLIDALESCSCDVVLTDYQIVNMQDGSMMPVRAGESGIEYGKVYESFWGPAKTLPSIHGTTYKTSLLRKSGFAMQDGIFFVDEEYVILPYLEAKSLIYYPLDIYRYQVANPQQSTSPKNRAKYYSHREKILKRLIQEYQKTHAADYSQDRLNYCFERIRRGIGDHFTTLLIYIENKKEGRKLAGKWKEYIQNEAPEFWPFVRRKTEILMLLNRLHISQVWYVKIKDTLYHNKK